MGCLNRGLCHSLSLGVWAAWLGGHCAAGQKVYPRCCAARAGLGQGGAGHTRLERSLHGPGALGLDVELELQLV